MNNRNSEGYHDPTAYVGMSEVVKDEKVQSEMVRKLMYHLKYITQLAGFELVGRIQLKHKKSGRVFK